MLYDITEQDILNRIEKEKQLERERLALEQVKKKQTKQKKSVRILKKFFKKYDVNL